MRPSVLIQLDLDSLWAVRSAYGMRSDAGDAERDPFYSIGLLRFLDLFKTRGVPATLFAIGRDCGASDRAQLFGRAVAEGHELANHSHSHPIGLGALEADRIDAEIEEASQAIARIAGARPVGFRAPGFDASPAVLQAVARAGLLYDASALPTRFGGLLRGAAGWLRSRNGAAESRSPQGRYGSGPLWRAPRQPYVADPLVPWQSVGSNRTERGVLEIPCAVTPWLRLPVHASVAAAAGRAWTRRALATLARRDAVVPYVFHLTDLVGGEEVRGLPGGWLGRRLFARSALEKRAFVESVLDLLLERCIPVLTRDYAVRRKGETAILS